MIYMYQNCCKKCGSISLHIEKKGNNTGLYCNDCGAFLKWLGKDELRAFEYSQLRGLRSKITVYDDVVDDTIKKNLQDFIDFLEKEIDREYSVVPVSDMDAVRKNAYCFALEKDKQAIGNILAGRKFDYIE